MTKAFDTRFERCHYRGRDYRARTGPIMLPNDLAPSVEAVLGLDDRTQAKAHFRVLGENSALPLAQPAVSYSPQQVAQLYRFPSGADGTGQTVGIIELGGGYKPADIQNYFTSLGLKKLPTVISVSVDKAKNSPTTANSADGEVLLDIEVVGAVAPGAKIVVYFAPNTTRGFQDALTTAIHDAANKPSAISISWGSAESTWTAQSMNAFDTAAQDAAALGVTISAASGDNGSSDGETDNKNHVDFPASSPHILACGGTALRGSNGAITSETVWNDGAQGGASGGGYSTQFPMPAWQTSAKIKAPSGSGRGVPDVAGDADPNTGYNVLVDGQKAGHRRNQRRRPLVERPDRTAEPKARKARRLLSTHAIRPARRRQGFSRHHQRQQRRVFRGRGVGRCHRPGFARRDQSAGRAFVLFDSGGKPLWACARGNRGTRRRRRVTTSTARRGRRPASRTPNPLPHQRLSAQAAPRKRMRRRR